MAATQPGVMELCSSVVRSEAHVGEPYKATASVLAPPGVEDVSSDVTAFCCACALTSKDPKMMPCAEVTGMGIPLPPPADVSEVKYEVGLFERSRDSGLLDEYLLK